ncbi:MAG: hypothetical protein U1E45_10315 [Geminicoccaceae bacterium]
MPFAAHRLRSVFEAQSEIGFMAWSYVTTDPLRQVLDDGYFSAVSTLLRPGDLVYLGISPLPSLSPWTAEAQTVRRCLLMVAGPAGRPRMRLVQDYGGPDDPSTAIPEAEPDRPAPAVGRRARRR